MSPAQSLGCQPPSNQNQCTRTPWKASSAAPTDVESRLLSDAPTRPSTFPHSLPPMYPHRGLSSTPPPGTQAAREAASGAGTISRRVLSASRSHSGTRWGLSTPGETDPLLPRQQAPAAGASIQQSAAIGPFGSSPSSNRHLPLVDHSGVFNVDMKGMPKLKSYYNDLFHTLVNVPNTRFYPLLAVAYALLFGAFALPYYLEAISSRACIPGVRTYLHAVWFSVQTSMTIGYGGDLTPEPDCVLVNTLVAIQSVCSLLVAYSLLGVVYARFALPTRRESTLVFSKHLVLNEVAGTPMLSCRVANIRKHQLIEVNVRMLLAINNVLTEENESIFRFTSLPVFSGNAIFLALPCAVSHAITPQSPLHGLSLQMMERAEMELIVLIEGVDSSTSSKLQARHAYFPSDILVNHRFATMVSRTSTGRRLVDFTKFDEVIPVPEAYKRPTAMPRVSNSLGLAAEVPMILQYPTQVTLDRHGAISGKRAAATPNRNGQGQGHGPGIGPGVGPQSQHGHQPSIMAPLGLPPVHPEPSPSPAVVSPDGRLKLNRTPMSDCGADEAGPREVDCFERTTGTPGEAFLAASGPPGSLWGPGDNGVCQQDAGPGVGPSERTERGLALSSPIGVEVAVSPSGSAAGKEALPSQVVIPGGRLSSSPVLGTPFDKPGARQQPPLTSPSMKRAAFTIGSGRTDEGEEGEAEGGKGKGRNGESCTQSTEGGRNEDGESCAQSSEGGGTVGAAGHASDDVVQQLREMQQRQSVDALGPEEEAMKRRICEDCMCVHNAYKRLEHEAQLQVSAAEGISQSWQDAAVQLAKELQQLASRGLVSKSNDDVASLLASAESILKQSENT